MPISLSKEHRKLLENTTAQARVLAEMASKAALENLAVHEKGYRPHMADQPVQRDLRNRLRSRAKALGDARDPKGEQSIRHLTELAAYEHWHRLLFTRFLTENHLLITDEENGSVPITLDECEELAPELGARDGFDLACRFASRILPGVFRRDDPVLELPIALNDQVAMRNLLNSLPSECFQADDALGWTYQFWQAQRKKEVNDSGKKIGADELSPVTQLFTEDYMVEFLLHNTIGAWWAGKLGPIQADTEEEARVRAGLDAREGVPAIVWSYLRFVQDETTKLWSPAAGTFEGWPRAANLIRLLDPSMGSGHFLVFALPLLVRLRMEEEQLVPKAAVIAVLDDNIHGLELDERCTQIAAFNVAVTAWKLAGYQSLPQLHLACSGLAPSATYAEWMALASTDDRLQNGMARLYRLFKDASMLGSLINPRIGESALLDATFEELQPLLEKALAQETKDDTAHEMAVIAQGVARAAEILAGHFTLVTTNVPYLGRPNQDDVLKEYCDRFHRSARSDLATCFIERSLALCAHDGSVALVTPQSWLFQPGYKVLRRNLLESEHWLLLARLGPRAFETISGEQVNVCLLTLCHSKPVMGQMFAGVDVTDRTNAEGKKSAITSESMVSVAQSDQLKNPDTRISLQPLESGQNLEKHAVCIQGLATSDDPQFTCFFWEFSRITNGWEGLMGTVEDTCLGGGRERLIHWEAGSGRYYRHAQALKAEGRLGGWKSGTEARGKMGVLVSQMSMLPVTLYSGEFYDHNASVIVTDDPTKLPAIWAFASSAIFGEEVRKLDSSMKPSNNVFVKVPFDLSGWKKVAAEKYPNGLPKSHSDDPTQWLFNGNPKGADQPLHVAVARLLGYQWPRQTGSSFPDCPALGPDGLEGLAGEDGIVCLPAVNHEQPAANRLRSLLAAALGSFDEASLVAAAGLKGSKSKTLEEWLRDEFFEQHAKLFHDRPFIWHLWDGRTDGFHVLVNYHKLDHATLQKLTYSYLGDWIQDQARDAKDNKPGAAERLGAAQELQKKLAAILEGEAPLDIFVRWKPLKDQAEGWNPDLNDGVRQNIRPFLLASDVGKRGAGLFRAIPLKLKESDRGNEPQRPKEEYPWFWCEEEPGTDPAGGDAFVGTRWNNFHLTLGKKKGAKA
jgi:hypothetical protein